jgi:hypothetical protein
MTERFDRDSHQFGMAYLWHGQLVFPINGNVSWSGVDSNGKYVFGDTDQLTRSPSHDLIPMQDALNLLDCLREIRMRLPDEITGSFSYESDIINKAITAWNEKYKIPNKETQQAIREALDGKGLTITTLEELKEEFKNNPE